MRATVKQKIDFQHYENQYGIYLVLELDCRVIISLVYDEDFWKE